MTSDILDVCLYIIFLSWNIKNYWTTIFKEFVEILMFLVRELPPVLSTTPVDSIINFHFPWHLVPICFGITRLFLLVFSTLIFMPLCIDYRKNHPVYQHHMYNVSLYFDVCSFIAGIFISYRFYFQIQMLVVVTGSYFYLFCKMYCQWWWIMHNYPSIFRF